VTVSQHQHKVSSDCAALKLRAVGLTYRSAQKETRALDGFSLEVACGEPIAIIGPSGCGKTSLLNLIAGLRAPTTGEVIVRGQTVTKPRQQTSLILQDYGLLPWKTVLDNAALGLVVQKVSRSAARAQAQEALRTVGIEDFAAAYPGELSGGMRQRLALARAMALQTDLMLMDEPLSALDALTREELQNVLLDLWQNAAYAQVLVTHSVEEAVLLGKRIVLMTPRPGKVRAIIDNPAMGSRAYRQSATFHQQCTLLRQLLLESASDTDAPDDKAEESVQK